MATVKSFSFREAAVGSFSLPLTLPAGQEFFLTSVIASNIVPGDQLKFDGLVGWSVNATLPGLAEIIVRIRRGSATGPVVFETRDSIFLSVNLGSLLGTRTTTVDHAEIAQVGTPASETYFLTVRFENLLNAGTTRIEGPIHLSSVVYGP
ncbi:hypothetical protein V7068_14445 [Bacillus sp. JJ634]